LLISVSTLLIAVSTLLIAASTLLIAVSIQRKISEFIKFTRL
jgi:hypothetical protein